MSLTYGLDETRDNERNGIYHGSWQSAVICTLAFYAVLKVIIKFRFHIVSLALVNGT